MKHTPKPWNLVISSHRREWYGWIIGRNGSTVAAISKSKEKEEANAHLINTAPELLSELVSILRCFDRDNTVANHFAQPMGTGVQVSITYSQIKRVRAAIAKAVSEPPSDYPT